MKIFMALFLMLAVFFSGLTKKSSDYLSEWRVVLSGEMVVFEHNLGGLPAEVNAWVAAYDGKKMPSAYQPYLEVIGVHIMVISESSITVDNQSGKTLLIRVTAWR
jgi:hypothetical protein